MKTNTWITKLIFGIVILCITLMGYLPLGLHRITNRTEQQLLQRANATPLLIGAKGSAVDLVLNSLYYETKPSETIKLSTAEHVEQSGLGTVIPLYTRFKARRFPIIGTTLDYFAFRNLTFFKGHAFTILGDCVLGYQVARKLALEVGDNIHSTAENSFNLAGVYPLQMHVTGILKPKESPDDNAIFVDLKTAWVIQGLGHGHQDLSKNKDNSIILKKDANSITANAKLIQFIKITKENRQSFHFHGDDANYPITSAIVIPNNKKSETLLIGRYQHNKIIQIIKPTAIIDQLMQRIFKVKDIIDSIIGITLVASLLSIILIFMLSKRLRQNELTTMTKIGCSRLKLAEIMTTEIIIILSFGFICITALLFATDHFANSIIHFIV